MITPTKAQAEVRDHDNLSLLVVAPAGCGKTEALALRVAGFIDRGSAPPPQRILAVTFTHRAKDNIRARLRRYVPLSVQRDRVTVTNFHGLAARIIRAHGAVAGINPNITICENDWVREQCHSRKLDWDDIKDVEKALQVAKLEAHTDEEVSEALGECGNDHAIDIEALRAKQNRATYDDLLRYAELILANDAVADLYAHHFGAVIVDEYQDLTPQQLRVINRIAYGRTTYAGDLAQGIYGFAGAAPSDIDAAIRAECASVIEFSDSHRSSPAVLAMVNSLNELTGGTDLTCADPSSWPQGGLAGILRFTDVKQEAADVLAFAAHVLTRAPGQRIGVIVRIKSRLRFIATVVEASDHPVHRWEDGVLDPETARRVRTMLARIDPSELASTDDTLGYLRQLAELERVEDFDSRSALADAINWVLDRFANGDTFDEVRAKIRVGDQTTLLNAPGIHLLSGHVGKGQQFDWVIVVGLEQGCIPDFRATTPTAKDEEARALSVMLSRARHGALVTYTRVVPTLGGSPKPRTISEYWPYLLDANPLEAGEIDKWLASARWDEIAER
ncbi:UvrD-helicase domain-containing protein [Actinopolymorpha alba]|uniref:UvrD-helicase domain-containing protein n=1 Tax=Actinopolymorpha alba TaxID=533267 RepID=UPI000367C662|nr:ATP-dependent helicase [Actinopolymorpha alba]